jgi:hypothetical protein
MIGKPASHYRVDRPVWLERPLLACLRTRSAAAGHYLAGRGQTGDAIYRRCQEWLERESGMNG